MSDRIKEIQERHENYIVYKSAQHNPVLSQLLTALTLFHKDVEELLILLEVANVRADAADNRNSDPVILHDMELMDRRIEELQSQLTITTARADAAEGGLLNAIGGVLSYSTTGHNKPCGQTVGANGCGDYCILFGGTPDEAQQQATSYIRQLAVDGYNLTTAIFVPNNPNGGYFGNPLRMYLTPEQTHE